MAESRGSGLSPEMTRATNCLSRPMGRSILEYVTPDKEASVYEHYSRLDRFEDYVGNSP